MTTNPDQSLDEIKLLQYIKHHDPEDKYNVLHIYDYFYHKARTPTYSDCAYYGYSLWLYLP